MVLVWNIFTILATKLYFFALFSAFIAFHVGGFSLHQGCNDTKEFDHKRTQYVCKAEVTLARVHARRV